MTYLSACSCDLHSQLFVSCLYPEETSAKLPGKCLVKLDEEVQLTTVSTITFK
jgi:hypothetical protein